MFQVAPTSATALSGPKPPDPAPVISVPPAGNACGTGGDGSGGGTPTRFDNVSFGLRPFSQDRALMIASGAVEASFKNWGAFDLVFGYAQHRLQRDDGASSFDGSFSAGVSRALTPTLRLRAAAARKVRMPSVQQLYDTLTDDPSPRRPGTNRLAAQSERTKRDCAIPATWTAAVSSQCRAQCERPLTASKIFLSSP